jgi:hypothetical protein
MCYLFMNKKLPHLIMKIAVRTQLKGTVARDGFLTIPTYLGCKISVTKILDREVFSSFL